MTNRPSEGAPATFGASPTADRPAQTTAGTGTKHCPGCGALNHPQATVCQDCGEPLASRPRTIRCRRCRHTAPSNLVICPHCGRELTPAPSRWLTWIVPGLLILLFALALLARAGGGPAGWLRNRINQSTALLADVSQQMDPQLTIEMTPIVEDPGAKETNATETNAEETNAGAPNVEEPIADVNGDTDAAAVAIVPTATVVAPTASPPTAVPPTTVPPTATAEPTATVAPTATSVPTDTPAPTATAAAPTRTATAAATVTRRNAATAASNTATAAAATDESAAAPLLVPTATSAVLTALIPTATPTAAPTATPTATPTPQTYTVQPGDTFVSIAARLGVTANALLAANAMTPDDARLLSVGQELTVPSGDAPERAAPTIAPTATPGPTRAPATPTPTPAGPTYRLDAPVLRSPENGTFVSCGSNNQLTWIGVPFMQPTDQYVMHLGFVSGAGEAVTWIMRQPRPSNRTSWDMDNDLCSLAPQEFGRQWRWYVEVVDEQGTSVSRPSEPWAFSWN